MDIKEQVPRGSNGTSGVCKTDSWPCVGTVDLIDNVDSENGVAGNTGFGFGSGVLIVRMDERDGT